jgi:hypothetical protein
MNFKAYGAAILLAGLPLGALAVAQTATQPSPAVSELREKVRAACAQDVQKFCANVERGKGGGMSECMQTNEANLSPNCKAARAERSAARAKEKG